MCLKRIFYFVFYLVFVGIRHVPINPAWELLTPGSVFFISAKVIVLCSFSVNTDQMMKFCIQPNVTLVRGQRLQHTLKTSMPTFKLKTNFLLLTVSVNIVRTMLWIYIGQTNGFCFILCFWICMYGWVIFISMYKVCYIQKPQIHSDGISLLLKTLGNSSDHK